MRVIRYTCPGCDYSKYPVIHGGCSASGRGILTKIGGDWQCDACGETESPSISCAKCGESIPATRIEEVDMNYTRVR
jgi:hypothetical protein